MRNIKRFSKYLRSRQTHQTETNEKSWKADGKSFFWSVIFIFASGLLLFFFLRNDQGKSLPLLASVYKYKSPEWGMIFMSALFTSLGWLLAWFLIFQKFVKEMSIFGLKIVIIDKTPKFLWFIFGLPPVIMVMFAAASILGLLVLPPSCEVPGIIFTVRAGNGEAKEYTPESEAIIEPSGSSIVYLKSYPSEDNTVSIQDDLTCTFQAAGNIVERIDTPFRRSCLTTIYLKKNVSGRMVVNANVKGKYCDIESSYNISILVK